ncbi:MAG: TolC family protein [Ignavibacteriae bacterium]|nr:TolC family protein [Ignavibacteriota bacterium]
MIKKFAITICILLAGVNFSYSQYKKSYTLGDAINEAMRNNSELVNARYDKMKAMEKVSQTYNENLIPTLELSSQYSHAYKKPVFNIFGQNFEIGTDNTVTHTLTASEPIPFLGTPVFSGIRIAEYYANLQNENVASVESKIKKDVKKAYYNVLFLKEVVELNRKSLQNSVDNLTVVEARYRNGVNTEFDFLRAKVKVESTKPTVSQSESNLEISKKLFKNTIGLKTSEDIDVKGFLTYDSTEITGSTDDILKKIAENNVSVRQLNISQLINAEIVTIDKASYLPKFYLFAQYQLAANENNDKAIMDWRYYNIFNAGIGMSWDLNFFRTSYKKTQSELEVKKTSETIADVKQKLKISGQNIISKMEDAKSRIKANLETVKLAERGYELANISFKNGVINQIDVLDAELMVNQTKLAYIQAIYDYLQAKAELEELLEK